MTHSVQPGNIYRFKCPVVGREELWLACVLKRTRHWRGDKIESDCATCMRANKCPAIHMIKKELSQGRAIFVDTTPALHQLHKDISERISKVMISRSHGHGTGISDQRLSELVGYAVVGLETDPLHTPPSANSKPAELRSAKKTSPRRTAANEVQADASDSILDHVKDIADHITDAVAAL